VQPSSSSGLSSPLRPASDPPGLFVDPKALSLAPSSSTPIFEPASLQPPLLRPQPSPSPTNPQPGADPVLESLFTSQDIFSSYPCDTLDLPFPASQEVFDLTGFDELNFNPGAGQLDLGEMFDWENVLGDGELRKWGGGWEEIDNTWTTGLDLGNGEFELGEELGGDDGRELGLDGSGINLAVGSSIGVDTAVNVAARVGVPAVLPTPSRLLTGRTIAGSSSGSSGPVDSSGNGSGSDGLSFPDLSTFPISHYTNYAQQLQALQSQTEAQSLWDVPIEESPLSLSDYVDYTMCRTPSVAGPSRGVSLGPSRPLSRAASASASGTGRGRSLSRSSVPPGTTPSRGRSIGSTRGCSSTKSTGGASSRATSLVSRADSHEGVGRRMRDMRGNSFVGTLTGPTTSRVPMGGSGIGLDLSEMQVDTPPPTLPPPSAILMGSRAVTEPGMGAVSCVSPQPVSSHVFRNVEVIGGMDVQMLAAFGGVPPSSSTAQPTNVQPSQLDLIEPPTAPTMPSSMPPSTNLQPQPTHIQNMPPPGIPTVSSEDLAGIAGQGAIAWDPSQPPPAGYLLVAVPIPNSISPAATSNFNPGTALSATGTIHSTSLSSSGTELQNGVIPGIIHPSSGIETWDINPIDYPGGVMRSNGLEQDPNFQSQIEEVQGGRALEHRQDVWYSDHLLDI